MRINLGGVQHVTHRFHRSSMWCKLARWTTAACHGSAPLDVSRTNNSDWFPSNFILSAICFAARHLYRLCQAKGTESRYTGYVHKWPCSTLVATFPACSASVSPICSVSCAAQLCNTLQRPAFMPQNPHVRRRHIQVDANFLPNPATKLVITECFESFPEANCWAWLIVGVFYNHRGHPIWSTEVFYAQLDVEFDTDENIAQANWSGDEQDQGMQLLLYMFAECRGFGTNVDAQHTFLIQTTVCSKWRPLAFFPGTTFVKVLFRLIRRPSPLLLGIHPARVQFRVIGKHLLNQLSDAGYTLGSLTIRRSQTSRT